MAKRDRTSEGDPQKGKTAEPERTEEVAADAAQAEAKEKAAEKGATATARKPSPGEKADAEATEEKPRRARRARAKAEKREEGEDVPGKDEAEERLEEERAADAEDEAAGDTEEKTTGGRRRGAAETSTGAGRRRPARRPADEQVAVRARARYVRTAPRKARLVVDHIRGKSVEDARAILRNTPRAASKDVLKLLESCVANAENNHELDPDELRVGQAFVDEGPTIKRYRPRALGRATRINKRTSHMTITLVSK